MKIFFDSMRRFKNIDGKNFGSPLWHVEVSNTFLECRIHKGTNFPAVIQYFTNGRGYSVYLHEAEINPVLTHSER